MRIKWLKEATINLDEAMDYIAQEDPDAAKKIYQHIRSRVAELASMPGQGRPGRIYGTRELVIDKYPYLIPYRIKNDEIQILRVFHTSRIPPAKW